MPDGRRKQIIEAAFRVLKTSGLQNFSFLTVAEDAGVSRQLIRYYFSDVEDLLLNLCDELFLIYREDMLKGAARAGGTRSTFFMNYYFGLVDGRTKPNDDRVYDALLAFAAGSEKLRTKLSHQYGLLGQVLSHELQLDYPDMTDNVALEISWLFVCLMYGHWKMVESLGYSSENRYITRRGLDRLIRSYLSDEAPEAGSTPVWSLDRWFS